VTAVGLVVATLTVRQVRRAEDRRIQGELKTARRERSEGRTASAFRRLTKLAEERPDLDEVLFELGLSEAARGRPDAALTAWRRIRPGSPMFPSAAARVAQGEIGRGRFTAAEELLTTALTGPNRAEVRDALVRLLRSEGRFDEARRRYMEGVADSPDLAGALRGLTRLDADPFAVEGIRLYLDSASRQSPDDDRVWLARAHLETQLGRFEEADRWLTACTKRRPDDKAVWRARLDWARAADRPEAVFSALPHLPADERFALDLRSWFAARRGDRDAEREALEHLVAVDPGRVAALARLAELADLAGRPDQAERYRNRKAEVDRAREAFHDRLSSPDYASHAAELAGLAEALGLRFESAGWSRVAGRPDSGPLRLEPDPPSGRTLADLLGDLAPTRPTEGSSALAARRELRFADDAEAVGLRFFHENGAVAGRLIPPVTFSGGVALLDYDRDGWLDVYAVQGGEYPPRPDSDTDRPGDRLFRNRGDGTFEDVTEPSGIARLARGYGHGVTVGDVDSDGRPDVFVTRWRSYALYRNRGDGTFEDVTRSAGLDGDRDWPTSAAFADLDNDGDLDLYVCHYLRWDENDPRSCVDPKNPAVYNCSPRHFAALPDHVFRNDGGRFTDVSAAAGVTDADQEGRGLGVLAAHLDDDDRIDLFVANDMSANYLFKNLGDFRFEEAAFASGVASNAGGGFQAGMGVACGDLDGDGRPDLAVTNFYGESTTLFRNLGSGRFADHTAAVGLAAPSRFLLGFGVDFLDADNDGRLDLMTVNGHVYDGRPLFPWTMPAQLLLGGARGRLTEVSPQAGAPFLVPRMGRGLAVGDLDNDGRVDALVLAQNEPLAYFHNRSDTGHSVTLELEGRVSNRDAVGARVTVTAGGRTQALQRIGGGSFQSAGDPRLHVGLGASTRVDGIEVRWPSGRTDRYSDLTADAGYHLTEGDPKPRPLAGWPSQPKPRAGRTAVPDNAP